MRTAIRLVCGAMLLFASPLPAAEIHVCREAGERPIYTDRPCPSGSRVEAIRPAPSAQAGRMTTECGNDTLAWQDLAALAGFDTDALPPAQRQAFAAVVGGLAYGRVRELRWHRARNGELHFCLDDHTPARELAIAADGRIVRFRRGVAHLLDDPTSPVSRLDHCSDAITHCVESRPKQMDRCVEEIPVCTEPGGRGCCPKTCKDDYRAARAAGSAPIQAFRDVLFDAPSCIAGRDESRERLQVVE